MSNTPHDHLVRHIFAHPEHARGLLRHMLPDALAAQVDWDALEHVPGSFVDSTLSDRHADLLYRVRAGERPLLCYLLLEHQSRPDPYMPLRMLGYAVRAWEYVARSREHEGGLPPIVPLLLCHTEGGWVQAVTLRELLDVDEVLAPLLDPYIPDFRLLVDDLGTQTDHELRTRAMSALGRVTLLALRNARQPSELRAALERWLEIAREAFAAPSGLAAALAVIHYLLEGTEVGHTWAQDYFHKLGSGAQEAFMTGAEALRNEGRVEGEAQIVLRQLSRKFGELPPQVTERVRAASPDELERWAEQLLTAKRLEEVFKA